jgi:hypothetical protein
MRISKALVAVSTLAIIGLGSFSAVSGAAAVPPTPVGNDHVTCDSFTGSGKFSLPLSLVPAGPTTLTLKGTLDGCVDTDTAQVTFAPSSVTEVVTFSSNFATALATPQVVTASADIKWKFDKTSSKTDLKTTHLSWTAQPAAATVTVPGLSGAYNESSPGAMTMPAGQAFSGGDNGASSTFTYLLGQSTGALTGQLFDQGSIKTVTIGAGQFTIG